MSLLPSTALLGWAVAGFAHEAPASSSSSIGTVEFVTAVALVSATVLSFWFWYVANKPNIIVKPTFKSSSTTVVITNEGRTPAKSLRIMSKSLKPFRGSEDTLDVRLPAMYPKEQIEYYVGPGREAVDYEPYEFVVTHRRWLSRWPTEKRCFTIDFKQYEAMLTDLHVATPLERDMRQIARIGNALIQMRINKRDRPRLWRLSITARAKRLAKRAISNLKKLIASDG